MKWVYSDPHYGHANLLKFRDYRGELIRPGYIGENGVFRPFADIEHHDSILITRYNDRVADGDKVYILGDIGRLEVYKHLKGKKRLILGNHDDKYSERPKSWRTPEMRENLWDYFEDILGSRTFMEDFSMPVKMIHEPVHAKTDFPAVRRVCVHGHIHEKKIMRNLSPDPWYINVCVEHTNYAPLSWTELAAKVEHSRALLAAAGELR